MNDPREPWIWITRWRFGFKGVGVTVGEGPWLVSCRLPAARDHGVPSPDRAAFVAGSLEAFVGDFAQSSFSALVVALCVSHGALVAIAHAIARTPGTGSWLTQRWRELESNFRFRERRLRHFMLRSEPGLSRRCCDHPRTH